MRAKVKIGLYPNISHKEYHAMTEYISSSYLEKLDIVPALAKVEPPDDKEESYVLTFGRAFHTILLEGSDAFEAEFAYEPDVNKRTKEGKEELAVWNSHNSHKTALKSDSKEILEGMFNAVVKHPFACRLLIEGRSEMSVFWKDEATGLPCKCRPDRIPEGNHGVIVSLKSVRDASYKAFQRDIINYGYYMREAMYCEGFNAVCNATIDAVVFICCEKLPPYRVECYTMEEAWMQYGKDEFHRLLEKEKECREKDFWPNYKEEGLTEIQMPNWFMRY